MITDVALAVGTDQNSPAAILNNINSYVSPNGANAGSCTDPVKDFWVSSTSLC